MKRKILYILISIVIAVGLWMYVITVVSPESEKTYYNIPVVLSNESVLNDKGLMIVTEKIPTVTLRLRGNRSDLNNLKNSDITLIADLSRINDAGTRTLTYSISYPGNFASNAFEELSRSPGQIMLEIVEWDTKDVPIVVNPVGDVPPEYIPYTDPEDIVLDREFITITGPKNVVDQITQARVNVILENQTQTISQSYRYTLCNSEGEPVDAAKIQVNAAEVQVTLKIQQVKELELKVEIDYQDSGLTAEHLSIVYSQPTIKVAGNEKILASLPNPLVLRTIKISEILENGTFKIPLNLSSDIENLSGLEEVEVTISFNGLKPIVLPISNIIPSTPPEGLAVLDVGTKICMIMLLVPEEQAELIQPEDLEIQVDLSGAKPGEGLYKAQVVVINPEFEDVAVVGTYNIIVELDEIVP